MNAEITQIIERWAAKTKIVGKLGKKLLQPSLALTLRESGLRADEEDLACVLQSGMPVWRSKDDEAVEPTKGRRRVDIVVYRGERLVAMIETESDLNDLRPSGVTRRNGHYDVWSIARSESGAYFHSYKSLERMAAAAYYWHTFKSTGHYPSVTEGQLLVENIRSSSPSDHNPGQICLILVSGSCRAYDKGILAPRLKSLGASLVCVLSAGH